MKPRSSYTGKAPTANAAMSLGQILFDAGFSTAAHQERFARAATAQVLA